MSEMKLIKVAHYSAERENIGNISICNWPPTAAQVLLHYSLEYLFWGAQLSKRRIACMSFRCEEMRR